jgi:hypothetical protein
MQKNRQVGTQRLDHHPKARLQGQASHESRHGLHGVIESQLGAAATGMNADAVRVEPELTGTPANVVARAAERMVLPRLALQDEGRNSLPAKLGCHRRQGSIGSRRLLCQPRFADQTHHGERLAAARHIEIEANSGSPVVNQVLPQPRQGGCSRPRLRAGHQTTQQQQRGESHPHRKPLRECPGHSRERTRVTDDPSQRRSTAAAEPDWRRRSGR